MISRAGLALSLSLGLLAAGCGREPEVPGKERVGTARWADPVAPTSPGLAAAVPQLGALFHGLFPRLGAPGVVVGVVDRRGLVQVFAEGERDAEAHAPVTPDTVFRVGSVTKVVTGLALLALRDAGKLDLDEPATRLLPELEGVVYPTSDAGPLRLRHFVTHSTGFERDGPLTALCATGQPVTPEALANSARGVRLLFAPGTDRLYSNYATALEGLAIGRAAGTSYAEAVQQTVLGPLGMTASTFDARACAPQLARGYERVAGRFHPFPVSELGVASAGGGLFSTVPDLARFAAYELDAWPPHDGPEGGPVRRSTLRESQAPAGMQDREGEPFGVHWVVQRDCHFGRRLFHNGTIDGYKAALYLLPDVGVGLVALANARTAELDQPMLELLGDAAFAAASVPPATWQAAMRLMSLVNEDRPEWLPELFAASALEGKGRGQIRRFLEKVRPEAGVCRAARPMFSRGPREGDVLLLCGLANLRVHVELSADQPDKLSAYTLTLDGACP